MSIPARKDVVAALRFAVDWLTVNDRILFEATGRRAADGTGEVLTDLAAVAAWFEGSPGARASASAALTEPDNPGHPGGGSALPPPLRRTPTRKDRAL